MALIGGLPQTRSPGGLNYNQCTCVELCQFIKDRTGEDIALEYSKFQKKRLIEKLVEADKNPGVFHFFNLAPELRNRVYEYGLYHNLSDKTRTSTSFLRTCKKINHEAKDLLISQSTFTIIAKVLSVPASPLDRISGFFDSSTVAFSGDIRATRVPQCTAITFFEACTTTWLPAILAIPHIHLRVEFHAVREAHSVNQLLYGLAEYLRVSEAQAKSITVRIEAPKLCDARTQRQMLYSLTRLPPKMAVVLDGLHEDNETWIREKNPLSVAARASFPPATQFPILTEYHRLKHLFAIETSNRRTQLCSSMELRFIIEEVEQFLESNNARDLCCLWQDHSMMTGLQLLNDFFKENKVCSGEMKVRYETWKNGNLSTPEFGLFD